MLLQLTDIEIKDDIGINNGILRKRFIRELKELKKTADYTSCDGGLTANFLSRVGPEYRGYTYSLIQGELSLDLMQRLSAADLGAMLGRVPGLPKQERRGAGQPDQDAARDERAR